MVLFFNVEMILKWLYVCICMSIWYFGRVEDEIFFGGGNVMVVRLMVFLIVMVSNFLVWLVKLDVLDGLNFSIDRWFNNLMYICFCYIFMIVYMWMKLFVFFYN